MTKHQFRAALAALGWTQGQLADELGISIRSVNGYASPRGVPIPRLVELAVKRLLDENK